MMPIKFTPKYQITSELARILVEIDVLKHQIEALPLTPTIEYLLREQEEIQDAQPYRNAPLSIRNEETKALIYMPPDAKDIPDLMRALMEWMDAHRDIPVLIVAAVAHYQLLTISPFAAGNKKAARILSAKLLHQGGYGLNGIYSLTKRYSSNPEAFYRALNCGTSPYYYIGKPEADITPWIDYFIRGLAATFNETLEKATELVEMSNRAYVHRGLDLKQRKALKLFESFETVTAGQVGKLFKIRPRTSSKLCKEWLETGFLEMVDPSKKGRRYSLAKKWR